MSKNTLTYEEKQNIITRYLSGDSATALAKEYKVPHGIIKTILDNPEARLIIEKKDFELSRAKESRRMDEIKDQMLTFISTAITEAMDGEKKIVFLDKIKGMIDSLDRIARLNRGELTDNTQHTEKKISIDVAAIVSELKTPEQKKEFLRKQLLVSTSNEEE